MGAPVPAKADEGKGSSGGNDDGRRQPLPLAAWARQGRRMKLATLGDGTRDGRLVVVSRDLARQSAVPEVAPTLQAALDDWDALSPGLIATAERLEAGDGEPFDPSRCRSPLPRAHHWVDGSAYVNHVELVRKARGAELPPSFWEDPLVYQGGSDDFLDPHGPARFVSEDHGIDIEGEVAVVTGDVPLGASPGQCAAAIRLVMLVNDWSLRHLIPAELAKGFGFYQSKPATAFSPVAVTPDELGAAWDGHRLHRPLEVDLNDAPFGRAQAGEDMVFGFPRLIEHATRTRALAAGAIVGSGTVSNKVDGAPARPVGEGGPGYSCLAEVRMIETIDHGAPRTPFLRFGDRVRIGMRDAAGRSIFGDIAQHVVRA
jgi:fumarylacetoacetate (FAA) hydrolase